MSDDIDRDKYPDGKLNRHDEGALEFSVGESKGNVVIDFGKPVVWVAMPPDLAVELALNIIKRARMIGITKPIEIEL